MSIKTKLQSLLASANATTGEADTDLTNAIASLIDGYGAVGGDAYFEKGTLYYAPSGFISKNLLILTPSEVYTHYVVIIKAVNTWLRVDGEWVEQEGLTFLGTGVTEYPTGKMISYVNGFSDRLDWIDSTGASGSNADNVASVGTRMATNGTSGATEAQNKQGSSTGVRPDGTLGIYSSRLFSGTKYRFTYEYTIVGWNDEQSN